MPQKLLGFSISPGASLAATNVKELTTFVECFTYFRIPAYEVEGSFDELVAQVSAAVGQQFGTQFKAVSRDAHTRDVADDFSFHIYIQVETDDNPQVH